MSNAISEGQLTAALSDLTNNKAPRPRSFTLYGAHSATRHYTGQHSGAARLAAAEPLRGGGTLVGLILRSATRYEYIPAFPFWMLSGHGVRMHVGLRTRLILRLAPPTPSPLPARAVKFGARCRVRSRCTHRCAFGQPLTEMYGASRGTKPGPHAATGGPFMRE
jgi:hypothetical protein